MSLIPPVVLKSIQIPEPELRTLSVVTHRHFGPQLLIEYIMGDEHN